MSANIYDVYPEYFSGEIISAEEFLKLQILSKKSYPEIVQKKITIRELEDLKNATCISINNGDGLLCVTKDGDIESVLKRNGAKLDGFLNIAFANAISNGGNKLDCYNCAGAAPGKGSTLGDNYCKRGFLPVCRIRFNRTMVDSIMAKTYGEPEVIFFIYCGDSIEEYVRKLDNKEYPGLSAFRYIPYIDSIQNILGMNADDMDYCFALQFRNVISEKWNNEFKEKFEGDFNKFMDYIQMNEQEISSWMKSTVDTNESISYPEFSIMQVLASQADENGDYPETDGIHLLLDALGKERVSELKETALPEKKHNFYMHNYYCWDVNAPEGLFSDMSKGNNRYVIGDEVFFVDIDENDEYAVLYASPIEDEDLVRDVYVFNDKNLANVLFDSMPFLVYKDELLWFIDKDENNKNTIYSYDTVNDEIKRWPIKVMDDVIALFPIHLDKDRFVYFYLLENDYFSNDDFTAISVEGQETINSTRIGEIVGINNDYIYCSYEMDLYRLDLKSMQKKSLDKLNLCEFNLDVVFIDVARDIVYSRIIDFNRPLNLSAEDHEKIQEMCSDTNYDTFTRGNKYLRDNPDDLSFEMPNNVLEVLSNCGDDSYREYGDEELIGIDSSATPVKIWGLPEDIPSAKEYDCSFMGDGFFYYKKTPVSPLPDSRRYK